MNNINDLRAGALTPISNNLPAPAPTKSRPGARARVAAVSTAKINGNSKSSQSKGTSIIPGAEVFVSNAVRQSTNGRNFCTYHNESVRISRSELSK